MAGCSSCSTSEPTEEPAILGSGARALAEYRTVRGSAWTGGAPQAASELDPRAPGPIAGLREPVAPTDGRIGIIEGLAAGCRFLVEGRQRPDIAKSYADKGLTAPTGCNRRSDSALPPAYPSLFSFPDLHSGVQQVGGIAKCVADAMFKLATSVEPLHVTGGRMYYLRSQPEGHFNSIWFLSKRPGEIADEAREELARVYRPSAAYVQPNQPWPADETLYTFGVPSASDVATWALLAVDYYRVAMLEAAWALACPSSGAYEYTFHGAPKPILVDTWRTMEMVDSIHKMEEAAKLAQTSIEAAAQARLATAKDKPAALAENWVSRFNSRLEGIRAYLPVPPQMFDGWRAVPLFTVSDGRTGDDAGAPWFSTDPYWWAAGAYSQPGSNTRLTRNVAPTGCFVHTPEGPAPEGTLPLVTITEHANSARVQSLTLLDGLQGFDLPALTEFRLEGYLEPTPRRGATVPILSCGGGTADGTWRWVGACGSCPRGATGTVVGYAFAEYPGRDALKGQFPIVTSTRQSERDRAAEHMIRITRIDPRMGTVGEDRADVDELIGRVARAYEQDNSGVFGDLVSSDVVDVDAVLRLLGTDRESFVRATERIAQQALALGRGITPDPSVTSGVPRVLGTEERWDAAEAVYYQALSQRSSHLARLYWPEAGPSDLEIMAGVHDDPGYFSMQHAHHGVYHAYAALLSVLRHPSFRLREQGRLRSSALQALEANLAQSLEGWARVRTSSGGTGGGELVGATSIALHDLRVQVPDAATASRTYEIWFGEAGLDCALAKSECDEAHYKFRAQPTLNASGDVLFNLFQSGASDAPAAASSLRECESSSCRLWADVALRIYVTRRDPKTGLRRPLVGFTLDGLHPVVQRQLPLFGIRVGDDPGVKLGVEPIQFIPFTLGPSADDITGGVAPDPEHPEDGETHCTGLKKVKLEDELMEAVKNNDDIESSFAYYLDVAEQAAERADRLGQEVIEAGFAVDGRSEIAREKLEELCGGVVNLERVEELSRDQGVDLAKLLTARELDTSSGSSVQLASDLTALRNCLGIGQGFEPVNVAVGSEPLCYWQFTAEGVELPPCVAPDALPDGTPIARPGSGPNGEQAVACPTRASSCLPSVFGLTSSDRHFSTIETTEQLGVTAGIEVPVPGDALAQIESTQRFWCAARSQSTRGMTPRQAASTCGYEPAQMSWVNHGLFRQVGSRLAVRLEPFYVAVITLDGRDWIRLGRPETGFDAAGVWPCQRHALLSSAFTNQCADNLLCGFSAESCGGTPTGWMDAQARLVNAVSVVKALGGASFDDFQHYWQSKFVTSLEEYAKQGSLTGMGATPGWLRGLQVAVQGKMTGLGPQRGKEARYPAVTDGIWYRATTDKGKTPVWCVPLAGDGISAPGFTCTETGRMGFVPSSHAGSFDRAIGSGWIAQQLREPNIQLHGSVIFESFPGKQPDVLAQPGFTRPRTYNNDLSLDVFALALQLVASVGADGGGVAGCDTLLRAPPTIAGPEDFPRLQAQLTCAAERVEGMVRSMMIPGIPKGIAETAAAQNGVQHVVPVLRGEMGESVASLTGWIQSYSAAIATVSRALRDLSRDFEVIGAQLRINDANDELSSLAMISKISTAAGRCGDAVGKAMGPKGWLGGGIASAAAVCSDTVTQTALAMLARDAEQDINDESRQLILLEMADRLTQRMDSIDDARRALGEGHAKVSSAMAEIDSTRNQAGREVAKALGLESDEAGRVFPVSAVMRAHYNTAKVRYDHALWQAKRAAQMARLALEQRIGVDLRSVDYDLPLVQKPSSWVDTLCEAKGIDYDRIRQGNSGGADVGDSQPTQAAENYAVSAEYDYANAFIGDYVTNLKRVRDSWSAAHPFQDGDDLVVLSLRDELKQVVRECAVEGWNALLETASCTAQASTSQSVKLTWEPTCSDTGCAAAFSESESPLSCYAADGVTVVDGQPSDARCPDVGVGLAARAVRLYQTDSPAASAGEVDDRAESLLPRTGLELWYRADDCRERDSHPGYVEYCSNRGTNLVNADRRARAVDRTAGAPSAQIVADGIGGRQSISFAGMTGILQTDQEATEHESYTLSAVYRVEGEGGAALFSNTRSLADGRAQWALLSLNRVGPGTVVLNWQANPPGQPMEEQEVTVGFAPAFYPGVRTDRGAVITLVVQGSGAAGTEAGTRIYINGHLMAQSPRVFPAQPLGGVIFSPGAQGGQLSEWLAYSHALGLADLRALHAYLGARYGIDMEHPAVWVEGDEVARVAAGHGMSEVSGFVGPADSIIDRARAFRYGALGASGALPALAGIGAGTESHAGLQMAQNNSLSLPTPGYYAFYANRQNSGARYYPPHDYLATFVAQTDSGSEQILWRSVNSDVLGQALVLEPATGRVMLQEHGLRAASDPGLIQASSPFVVSLRASSWRSGPSGEPGVVELFVNGERVVTADGVPDLRQHFISHNYNRSFIGVLGEYQLHLQEKSDDEVRDLHAQLAAKYGIPLSGTTVEDGAFEEAVTTATPEYRQSVDVRAGSYWLSWYQREEQERLSLSLGGGTTGSDVGTYFDDARGLHAGAEFLALGWVRHYARVHVLSDGVLTVGWIVPSEQDGTWFAAPQLERIEEGVSTPPKPFLATGSTTSSLRGLCEDSAGDSFRTATHWRRGVEYVCDDDKLANCDELIRTGRAAPLAYREVHFDIAQDAIDKGKLFARGGFARGNFNYRHKTVAVNVVGTRVKSCERSQYPSNCQANNLLQYSIRHDGPYWVRNHEGSMYEVPLFTGRIQQAKALLAERYLTNPVSGSDRALLSPFTSEQFWGRPLDGHYVLRIYDVDGLDWDAVEDVQLVLNYRFWTRLD
jgi:hypothetical protein